VKMRAGDHGKDIVEYEMTSTGLEICERMLDYTGLISGLPYRAPLPNGVNI